MPDLRVHVRADPSAVTGIAAGTFAMVAAPFGLVAWHALFTGGSLPSASTSMSRLMFRLSTLSSTRSALRASPDGWRATELYRLIETSEKGGISYRLGTVMAGVAADIALGIPLLTHRQSLFGTGSGRRGDLVGRRFGTGDWHGIEAKGRGPHLNTGECPAISDDEYDKAKEQAEGIGQDLITFGIPGGWSDHWACVTRAATAQAIEVVLDDPTSGDAPPPEAPLEIDFPQQDPEERLLQSFYQVVGDIEEMLGDLETDPPDPVPNRYRGMQIPGTSIWIGAQQDLFEARREERLVAVMSQLDSDSGRRSYEIAAYRAGLAVVVEERVAAT